MECVKFPFQLGPRGNYGPGSNDDDDDEYENFHLPTYLLFSK